MSPCPQEHIIRNVGIDSYLRNEESMKQDTDHKETRSGSLAEKSDETLFNMFQQTRDRNMIGELFKRYLHLVLGVGLKYLKDEDQARDVVMQVFEQLLTKPVEKEIRSFKDWLFIMTRNQCLMVLRHQESGRRMMEEKLRELQEEVMENVGVMHLDNEDEQEQKLAMLRSALARLPDDQRKCVEFFYYEEKSYQEISNLTGYSLKKVKSHLQNGKRNLKIHLDHGKGR